jgi:GAF domain-containing protein
MNIKFQHDRKESVREPLRERSQLRQELLQESIAGELCDALLTGMMTGTILTPVNHLELWETTVEIAASIIGAEYGALFILDEQTNELVFEVVLRGASKELKHFRMPANVGIAGHVALTRKSMAISDVVNNEHWNQQVGERVGIIPLNMISAPLQRDERLIGVLEVCNKIDGEMFGDADMKNLQLFANQVSIEIELSRSHQTVSALVTELLESCGHLTAEQKQQLRQQSFLLTGFFNQDAKYRQRLELAHLVQAIAWRGEKELQVCQTILRGFADYLA